MRKLTLLLVALFLFTTSLFAFDGYVDITNQTGYTIYYVYVSNENDDYWGDDMLGDDYLYDSDTKRVYLSGHKSSVFDIMVEDEEGDTYSFYSVDVEQTDVVVSLANLDEEGSGESSGEATVNGPGGDFDGYVDVTNDTGYAMYYLYIKQKSKSWGPDLLGDDVLMDGDTYTVNLNNFPNSVFDIRIEDEEGDTYSYYDTDVQSDDVFITLDNLD